MTLPQVDGEPVSLAALVAGGPALLVLAHADCPTSVLTLRRLSAAPPSLPVVCVAQEPPETAARLARRAGFRGRVLAEPPPFELSRALGADTVPTALRVGPDGAVTGAVAGWDADAYERLLGVPVEGEPRSKPGCQARWTYDAAAGGLDELEDMLERGWSDGLPVVPPTR